MTAPTVLAILTQSEADAQAHAISVSLARSFPGTPRHIIRAADLAALTLGLCPQQLAPVRTNLHAWLGSLVALGGIAAIVPMRFGQAAESTPEIERFLTCRQEHLRAVLALVGHRCELVIRLTLPAPAAKPALGTSTPTPETKLVSTGRSFLHARKQHMQSASGDAHTTLAEHLVRDAIGPHILALTAEPPTTTIPHAGISVLVPHSHAAAAISAIHTEAERRNVSLHVTGPLPPLGFASGTPNLALPVDLEPSPITFNPPSRSPAPACER